MAIPDEDDGASRRERLRRHGEVTAALAPLGGRRLGELLEGAGPLGAGVGGAALLLDVGGVPVFVKRVPLTDAECRPENVMSTADLFGLPAFCQYGLGAPGFPGPGFGAWRELAAHTMATGRVLAGHTGAFPLLHHWRVLPGAPPPTAEHDDIDAVVAYWHGSQAVRERLEALKRAPASLVLFTEFIPHTLDAWLAAQVAAGPEATAAACAMLESQMLGEVASMNAAGLMHFDAHFANLLTDGRRLYLADFGLATSARFDLSPQEAAFLERNRTHDAGYARMRLVNWLVSDVCQVRGEPGRPPERRNAFIRACAADGALPALPDGAATTLPDGVAETILRHAPVAAVMNDLYWELFGTSRATPYPAEQVERALRAAPAPGTAGTGPRP
ncbi:serine/threonine protein phosphatase [Streptosporangium sp. NPDC004379]|uniref:serine/threonine protein phosphatase n=1 Tax=Streptosporangium sp. NPDC004379 TaxID=3366189 RepID=UPI0036A0692D